MAKFLGHDLTDEQVKKLVDFCSFDKLKKSGAFEVKPPPEIDNSKQEAATNTVHMEKIKEVAEIKLLRKGQIGDWKNYFTEDMSKQIDEIVSNKLTYKKAFRFESSK